MIPVTVIGSYPTRLDGEKYARAYFRDESVNAVREGIEQAVQKQLTAGVDIISDGQCRGDFISLFARNFKGVLMQTKPVVVSEIEYMGASTVQDQGIVKSIAGDRAKVKGIITGPYTLAKSCRNRHYEGVEDLAYAFAKGLSREAKELDSVVDFIQVDEPFYSVEYPEYGRDLLGKVFSEVSKPKMLHVCGDVSDIFDDLTEFDVDYLEHEFAANPHLWESVSEIDFRQTLGVGVVRSDVDKVESIDELKDRMSEALKHVDEDKLMFNPDCGLRNLSPDVAFNKLRNMVAARNLL